MPVSDEPRDDVREWVRSGLRFEQLLRTLHAAAGDTDETTADD